MLSSEHPLGVKLPNTRPIHLTSRQIDVQVTENAEDIVQIIQDNETRNFQVGVVLIVVAVASWVIGLELVNGVLKGDEYKKPYMFAWITGSCFMLNFTPDLIIYIKSFFVGELLLLLLLSASPVYTASETDALLGETSVEKLDDSPIELTSYEVQTLAFQIALIYLFYNVFVMIALQFTSAGNATVLGSTTSVFTLVLGSMLNIDRFSVKKVICIFISLSGVFLINWSESGKASHGGNNGKYAPSNPILGNSLAILGAFMYAIYLIVMKIKCGTGNKTTNERVLFAWVGVYTFILGIPLLIFVHIQGIEEFQFPPPSNEILFLVLINGVFSVISDFSTILAMLLTSPLVVSLSLTSAIPITIFVDYIIKVLNGGNGGGDGTNFIYFLGIASILTSVVLINVNLTTENELINDVIEEALEEAIRVDEVLSPMLSPLLSPKSPFSTNPQSASQSALVRGVNFLTVLNSFSPKPAASTASTASAAGPIPGFELPHSQIGGFDSISATTDLEANSDNGKFIIFGGENHQYHLKNVSKGNQHS